MTAHTTPTAAERMAALDRFIARVAASLGVPVDHLPSVLNREQIAQVAGLGSAQSLSAAASRGAKRGEPRWVAYRATVEQGAHRVPVEQVAEWLAVRAGLLPLPAPAPASEGAAEHGTRAPAMPAPSLEQAWASGPSASGRGRVHRCLGGG